MRLAFQVLFRAGAILCSRQDRGARGGNRPLVKVELEVAGQSVTALSEDQLGDGAGFGSVIDLRRSFEVKSDPAPGLKEKNVAYYRMAIDALSLSEQDMDHLRRELARRQGPYAVVSAGGKRAATMLLMHAARTLGWSSEEALKRCSEVREDKLLSQEVKSYLEQHKDRSARHWSQEAGNS